MCVSVNNSKYADEYTVIIITQMSNIGKMASKNVIFKNILTRIKTFKMVLKNIKM